MIKVLVIVNAIFGYDGISSVATNYYRYQNKSAIAMDLVTINPIDPSLSKEISANNNRHFVLEGRNRNPLKYLLSLSSIIRKYKYDIVHIHGNSATMAIELLAAKIGGCKVRIAHSHNTRCDHKYINRLLEPLFRKLYTDCCACSKEAGRFLFGKRACYIVNNGLNLRAYRFSLDKREEIRAGLSLEDRFVVGHIGRFAYQKNHEFILRVFQQVLKREKNAVLLLVGEGELKDTIQRQAVDMGIEEQIVFYGTTNKVNEVVQAMDCFIFPSRFEGLGIVAIEAQASGIPCIASDQVPEKIKILEKTTFLSLDADLDTWADAVIAGRTTPEERASCASDVYLKIAASDYDIEKNCADMRAFYERIMRARGEKR